MQEEIAGEGVVLRRWEPEHLEQLRVITRTSGDHIATFMSSAAGEVADPDLFLAAVVEAWRAGSVFAYAVEENGRVVGHITFTPHGSGGEIGCWTRVEALGRGLATAALRTLTGAVFAARPDVTHLDACCNAANVPSARMLEKAGFRRTARRP